MTSWWHDQKARKALRQWMMQWWGDGETIWCVDCLAPMTIDTMTMDRFPIPGKFGGEYVENNVRPMCRECNNGHRMEPDLDWVCHYLKRMGIDDDFRPRGHAAELAQIRGWTVNDTGPLRRTIGES